MRKQILMIVAVSVAMAATATTAAAVAPPDFNNGNWAGVEANDGSHGLTCGLAGPCEFDSGTTQWNWSSTDPYSWGDVCSGSIAGEINADGSVAITDATLTGGWAMCPNNEPAGFPWEGQICYHAPTNSFWQRQTITLDGANGSSDSGTTFGEFVDYTDEEVLSFASTDSGIDHNTGYNHLHDADFQISAGSTGVNGVVDFVVTESACSWPEL